MVLVRSVRTGNLHRCRQVRLQLLQPQLDAVNDLDDVGARLSLHVENHRRRGVHPCRLVDVLRAHDNLGNVGEADRIAVLVGDDGVGVALRA